MDVPLGTGDKGGVEVTISRKAGGGQSQEKQVTHGWGEGYDSLTDAWFGEKSEKQRFLPLAELRRPLFPLPCGLKIPYLVPHVCHEAPLHARV